MEALEKELPSVAAEFRKGHFVVQKTHRVFSSIPIDQAHEQNNKIVKGDGGAIGLTEGSKQLLRWMVSGTEVSRIINDFKSSEELLKKSQSEGPDFRHHEQMRGLQSTFQKQVQSLCNTIEEMEMRNPFLEQSEDLLVLDTRDIMDSSVADTVRTVEEIGKQEYQQFVTERFEKRTTSLFDPIKRNKLSLFSSPHSFKSKSNSRVTALSFCACIFPAKFVMEIWRGSFVMEIIVFHLRCLNLGNLDLAPNQIYCHDQPWTSTNTIGRGSAT